MTHTKQGSKTKNKESAEREELGLQETSLSHSSTEASVVEQPNRTLHLSALFPEKLSNLAKVAQLMVEPGNHSGSEISEFPLLPMVVHYFPRAAITNYSTPGDLQQQKFVSSQC